MPWQPSHIWVFSRPFTGSPAGAGVCAAADVATASAASATTNVMLGGVIALLLWWAKSVDSRMRRAAGSTTRASGAASRLEQVALVRHGLPFVGIGRRRLA